MNIMRRSGFSNSKNLRRQSAVSFRPLRLGDPNFRGLVPMGFGEQEHAFGPVSQGYNRWAWSVRNLPSIERLSIEFLAQS